MTDKNYRKIDVALIATERERNALQDARQALFIEEYDELRHYENEQRKKQKPEQRVYILQGGEDD